MNEINEEKREGEATTALEVQQDSHYHATSLRVVLSSTSSHK